MRETTVPRPGPTNNQDEVDGTPAKPKRAETPQEFYRRITQRPEIRELLKRLAKR